MTYDIKYSHVVAALMEIFTRIPTVIYFLCYCKEHDFSYSALSLV